MLEDVLGRDFPEGVVEDALHHHFHPGLDLGLELVDEDVAVGVDEAADGLEEVAVLVRGEHQVRARNVEVEVGVGDGDARLAVALRDGHDSRVALAGDPVELRVEGALAGDAEEADDAGGAILAGDRQPWDSQRHEDHAAGEVCIDIVGVET